MKKGLMIILLLIIALMFTSCSVRSFDCLYPVRIDNGGESISELKIDYDNEVRKNTSVYLCNDKFIYTTIDEGKNNNFGGASKLMIYDFAAGKAECPINTEKTPLSDIADMYVIDNELLFTAYANTSFSTEYNWGFCLFSLNLDTYELKCIHETPNTVYNIYTAVIDNTLYYFGNSTTQTELEGDFEFEAYSDDEYFKGYSLYKYENSESKTIDTKYRNYAFDSSITFDNEYIYILTRDNAKENDIIAISTDGKRAKLSSEKASEILEQFNAEYEEERIEDKIIIEEFGDYAVLAENTNVDREDDDSCGYRYKSRYYLFDKNNHQQYKLSEGAYWYYYI